MLGVAYFKILFSFIYLLFICVMLWCNIYRLIPYTYNNNIIYSIILVPYSYKKKIYKKKTNLNLGLSKIECTIIEITECFFVCSSLQTAHLQMSLLYLSWAAHPPTQPSSLIDLHPHRLFCSQIMLEPICTSRPRPR